MFTAGVVCLGHVAVSVSDYHSRGQIPISVLAPGLGLHRPRADQDGPGAESVLAPAVRAGPGLISAHIIAIISAGLITPRWLTMEFAYLRSFVLDAFVSSG